VTVDAKPRLAYRPELDGVRAVAVLAVLGYHIGVFVPWFAHVFRGGFLGVDVFFVLSGMLITELLVTEHCRHGTVSLRGFYRRRARRLLPALVALLVIAIGYYQLVHGTGRATIDGLESLVVFVTTGHVGRPFPLGVAPVWTLLVEWEFYLIWPAVLVALLRRRIALRTLGYAAAAVAVTVTIVRALLFHFDHGNWILSYFFAWLRFDELLVGCAIGLIGARPQAPRWFRTVAFVGILVVISRATVSDHWLYLGGMFALATAAASVVQPRLTPWAIDRVLTSRPLVWIGKLSYSLYLWSTPVIIEVNQIPDLPAAVRVPIFLVGSWGGGAPPE
jgi:peptidoglycan/LPS O-acetylase OafA/YrhL